MGIREGCHERHWRFGHSSLLRVIVLDGARGTSGSDEFADDNWINDFDNNDNDGASGWRRRRSVVWWRSQNYSGLLKISVLMCVSQPWDSREYLQVKLTKSSLIFQEKTLSTSNRIFPYYQGESTIFDKGNFLYHIPDSNNLLNLRELLYILTSVWVLRTPNVT